MANIRRDIDYLPPNSTDDIDYLRTNSGEMVIVATPNLCFDRTELIRELVPGAVIRSRAVDVTAGGKGVNVARVLRAYGRRCTLVGLVGDEDRTRLLGLLADEGGDELRVVAVAMAGYTRTTVIMVEDEPRRVTVLNELGTGIDGPTWARYVAAVADQLAEGELLVCAGSLPPGAPVDGFGQVVSRAREVGAVSIVDTAPAALRAALGSEPDLVTPNLAEAEAALAGTQADLLGVDDSDAERRAGTAALGLCELGARRAAVTAGGDGVAFAVGGTVSWVPAVPVHVVSTVGAGDSFVGGVAVELLERPPDWFEAVLRGTATASASCERLLSGGVDLDRVQELLAAIRAGLPTPSVGTR